MRNRLVGTSATDLASRGVAPPDLEVQGASILVDARGLRQSGIGRYLRSILRGMFEDPRIGRVLLVGHPGELRRYVREEGVYDRVRVISFPFRFYSAPGHAHWLRLRAAGKLAADAAFFPHYDVPLPGTASPSVVTVQDLSQWKLPELFPRWKRSAAAVVLARAVRSATRVLVSSHATQRDLLEKHPEVAEKLSIIPLGVDALSDLGRSPTEATWANSLHPFILCVGNRKPHKNMVAAVEALSRLRRWVPDMRLVLVGSTYGDDGVRARAAELNICDAVIELGVVSDAELHALYAKASSLLFPSLYEGFGLPILEAMVHGVPVVASNRASIPEVVGDAGMVTDPADYDSMASCLRTIFEQPDVRSRMVRLGHARAAEFSWARTAQRTVDEIVSAASNSPAVALCQGVDTHLSPIRSSSEALASSVVSRRYRTTAG